jgi:hypothetical protein
VGENINMTLEQFKKHKEKTIEDFFANIPPEQQQRLRAIQWRLDRELDKYDDPVARMNKMVELFWKQVFQFQRALSGDIEQRNDNVVDLYKKNDR